MAEDKGKNGNGPNRDEGGDKNEDLSDSTRDLNKLDELGPDEGEDSSD